MMADNGPSSTLDINNTPIKPFPIQGRFDRERERLAAPGMTNAERKMRAQWVRDQALSHREPVFVPEAELELLNPIRRFYRWPLDTVFKALEPKMGAEAASVSRWVTGKLFLTLFGVYGVIYYFKYNRHDWTRQSGWRVNTNRPIVLPGDPGYPAPAFKKPQEYYTHGFENSPI